MRRFRILQPHLEQGVSIARLSKDTGVADRTLYRWTAGYRVNGLAGLVRAARKDKAVRRTPTELVTLIEGLALRKPALAVAAIHRQVVEIALERNWPPPSYSTVHDIVGGIDPGLRALAHEGTGGYQRSFDLVHRREAQRSNQIWQADHTELDLWVVAPSGAPARPWLTAILDDRSRAVAGYALNLSAPSSLNTALAFRHAIWRKAEPNWHVCGIPETFYVDHGSDFTSAHIEQVAADLKIQLVFSLPGKPRGRGKIERFFLSVNQLCLCELPGYAPKETADRPGQAVLTLAELDSAIGRFIVEIYNQRVHGETGQPPQQRWQAGGFLPAMPESLEQLDLLLLTVAKPRKVHPDGIHFQGLRYLDPTLAAYVQEAVTIRYDPRDLAEIRVFYEDRFLCRAICPELSNSVVSLKDITAARNTRRRVLAKGLKDRSTLIDSLIAVHRPNYGLQAQVIAETKPSTLVHGPRLKRYREE
jgi:putative transposase